MDAQILPFAFQDLTYDPEPGRMRLENDIRKLSAKARERQEAGDHAGAVLLARLALRYYHARYRGKQTSGPR